MFEKTLCRIVLMTILVSPIVGGCSDTAHSRDPHSGSVMNYHRIDDRLVTGGHLLDGGSAALKEEGVVIVINLRDDVPAKEEQRFTNQGIQWINIPVDWKNPTTEDFKQFVSVMNEHSDEHVLVQCAANYRASGMTYLYRIIVKGVAEEAARADMMAVWDPAEYAVWDKYIDEVKGSQ